MIIASNNAGIGLAQIIGCKLFTPKDVLNGIYPRIEEIEDGSEPIVVVGEGFGKQSTGLSSRRPVYGSAEWTDTVNAFPELGFELALKMGMSLPEYKIINDPEEQHRYDTNTLWEKLTHRVYLKKTSGRPLVVEAFFDGSKFKNYFVKIIEDRLLYNNVGCHVGCAVSTIFSMFNPKTRPMFDKLAPELAIECPEYRGVVTISALVFDDKIVFKHLTFGYDPMPEMAKIALCGKQIITGAGEIPTGYGSSITLYDIRNEKLRVDKIASDKYCIPLMVNREDAGIFTCGEEAAVCIGLGSTIKQSFLNAYEVARRVHVKDLCYRIDGGDYAITWWKHAQKIGSMK